MENHSQMTTLVRIAAALMLFYLPAAGAHEYQAGKLRIEHPWARATPPVATVGAAYLTIKNNGDEADALIGASSPEIAEHIEFHRHTQENGMMRMRPVAKVEIPPGGVAMLRPHGYHMMLFDLRRPLKPGDELPVTLTFERAGTIEVRVKVEALDADPSSDHSAH